jgi:hypothetical protein
MNKTITTIEGLAEIIQRTMASTQNIKAVEDWLTKRLDGIESRLGRLENSRMVEQKRKIENLEARMKNLKDALAI